MVGRLGRTNAARVAFRCLIGLAVWLFNGPSLARPYSVDDLLKLQSYGQIEFDPSGKDLLIEKRGPYASGRAFDLNGWSWRASSRIYIKRADRPPALLFPQHAGAGYWLAGFSPSGKRVAIFRLRAHRLAMGIVSIAGGTVHWMRDTPDLPIANPRPIWVDENRLLIVAAVGTRLPSIVLRTTAAERSIATAWQSQAAGRTPSVDVLGSGDFVARPPDRQAIRLIDARTGRSESLYVGSVEDAALSADRRFLAVIINGPAVPPDPTTPVAASDRLMGRSLIVLDLTTGKRQSLGAAWDVAPNLLSWSGRDDVLLIAAKPTAPFVGPMAVLSIAPQHMLVKSLLPDGLVPSIEYAQESSVVVRATWLGAIPVVLAHRIGQPGRSDWYAAVRDRTYSITASMAYGAGPAAAVDDDRLWVRDGARVRGFGLDGTTIDGPADASRFRTVLPSDAFEIGGRPFLNAVSILGQERAAREADHASPNAREPVCRQHSSVDMRLVATAAQPCRAAFVATDRVGRAALTVVDGAGGTKIVDRINQRLSAVDPARVMVVKSPQADGASLVHWLYLPPSASTPRPPLVILPYPGQVFAEGAKPPANTGMFMPGVNPELLAAHGFAVLVPSIPLAYGDREPMTDLVAPVLAAIGAVAATHLVDVQRIAVYGHSYGAYAALALAAQTSRFRSVIAASGVGDLYSSYGLLPPRTNGSDVIEMLADVAAWHESGQGRMGTTPWSDPARYLRNSPFSKLDHVTAPVLLIHGDMDGVSIRESERTFAGLARLGRSAMLLRYRGEGHVLASPANIADQWRRIFAFLDRTLRGICAGKDVCPAGS